MTPSRFNELLTDQATSSEHTTDGGALKVKFAFKATAFCASVISLSWFFEGWRKIHQEPGLVSISILVAGVVCTIALITIQAFWVYVEEKQKGALLRRISLFDKLYEGLVQRKLEHKAKMGEKAKHA